MSDTRLDIERDKYMQWKQEQDIAKRNSCEDCNEHNENCPYYNREQESWDYELCFEERGVLENGNDD